MVSDQALRVEDVGEAHIAAYVELSRAEYGRDAAVAQPAHLRWKFLANPQGAARGIHLYRGGAMVGRMVAQPRLFESGGRTARAAYIVDLVIHPEHRGMASLLELVRGLQALRASFDLILVTPNAAGLPVWERFVKLPGRFDLDVRAVPVRPARLLARRGAPRAGFAAPAADGVWRGLAAAAAGARVAASRLRWERAWPAPAALDALLAAAVTDAQAAGRRDRAFVQWRLDAGPAFRYDVDFLRKDGRLAGYVASRRTVYAGYDTRFVVDVLGTAALTRRDWSAAAWELLRRETARGGAELLMALGNAACGPLAQLARLPFAAVPAGVLPQRTTVFAQWWSEPWFDLRAESLQLTLADCDMI